MTPAFVSVVMPAFDAAPWIDAALVSVVNATWPRESLEIVVVDDGSRDDTGEIAGRRLAGSGVRHQLIRQAHNHGPSAARNLGWRRAGGEWIQFLDADDLMAPAKFVTQVPGVDAVPADLAMVVSPWQAMVERDGRAQPDGPLVDPQIGDDAVMSILGADNFMATGSQLFRRAWLDRVGGYDERLRLVEDVDLLLRIAWAGGRIRRVPSTTPLFWYRRRAGSLSTTDRCGFIEARLRNAQLAEARWRDAGTLTPARRQFLADLYSSAVRGWTVSDPPGFERVADHIETLEPAFVPADPPAVRRLARLVGYRRAERTAGRYRRIKALVKGPS